MAKTKKTEEIVNPKPQPIKEFVLDDDFGRDIESSFNVEFTTYGVVKIGEVYHTVKLTHSSNGRLLNTRSFFYPEAELEHAEDSLRRLMVQDKIIR